MAGTTPERDWKYMKKIKDDLLVALCNRINKQSSVILAETGVSEHEKYLKLYSHVEDSDRIVANCFNDWRRSTLFMKILEIKHHGLLTPDQLEGLSAETLEKLKALEQNF
jgi:hypothetical protein